MKYYLAVIGLLLMVSLTPSASAALPAGPVYGVTLDDAAFGNYTKAVTASQHAQSLGRTLTHQIVLDPGTTTADYAPAINALAPVSNIEAMLADSTAMKTITAAQLSAKATQYINAFGSKIDVYEVGNEINGEWLGAGAGQKAYSAYKTVKAAGYSTSLVPYYNPNCYSNSANQMLPWLTNNIPADMKAGLDYVFVSWYEVDCNNHRITQAEMDSVFGQLHTMFPNAKLGFGELGLANPVTSATMAKAQNILTYYYALTPSNLPAGVYVHGGFWWYGQEDLFPYTTKTLYPTFEKAILAY